MPAGQRRRGFDAQDEVAPVRGVRRARLIGEIAVAATDIAVDPEGGAARHVVPRHLNFGHDEGGDGGVLAGGEVEPRLVGAELPRNILMTPIRKGVEVILPMPMVGRACLLARSTRSSISLLIP